MAQPEQPKPLPGEEQSGGSLIEDKGFNRSLSSSVVPCWRPLTEHPHIAVRCRGSIHQLTQAPSGVFLLFVPGYFNIRPS
jgi:hypothetical protein